LIVFKTKIHKTIGKKSKKSNAFNEAVQRHQG
jgi:hypothetical protein